MSNTILFVFEGERTEPQVLENLKKNFIGKYNNTIIESIYDAELFQFMKQIKDDEYLDLVGLLKERYDGNPILEKYDSSEDFSEIYLFFDHDAHSHQENVCIEDYHKQIEEVLTLFDNETENGKLYISYPMVEAVKDTLVSDQDCTNDCCAYVVLNTKYKQLVDKNCRQVSFYKWTKEDWYDCISENLIRCYVLQKNDFTDFAKTSYKEFSAFINQIEILHKQLDFYKAKNGKIVIISGFALFLIEYYGLQLFNKLDFHNNSGKYCNYTCLKVCE